jgi:hypothetical protein
VDVLGKSAEIRLFLVSLLLTSRFHVSSRPISDSNFIFFDRLTKSCDALLDVLQEEGWESVDTLIEKGMTKLGRISDQSHDTKSQAVMNRQFRGIYRRYFRSLNVNWSSLAPSSGLKVTDWAQPDHILISVGPNIGIGDEIIFFELARRLRRTYPQATIQTSSFNKSVWDLLLEVNVREYESCDQLKPYVNAVELVSRHPNSQMYFVEFASTAMYRHLEVIQGLPRFVYLDTGARCVRVVEQDRHRIADTVAKHGSVYRVLDCLLAEIGLPGKTKEFADARKKPAKRLSGETSVFVNPFSSKDYTVLSPSWWSDALIAAAAASDIHEITIFAGTIPSTREYARKIADRCRDAATRVALYGEDKIPPIADMMKLAARCSVIFGLDTFTGHVGMICNTPCVSVFFGSEWDAWRVHNNHVLNVHIQDFPEQAGKLVARLLGSGSAEAQAYATQLVECTEAFRAAGTDDAESALACLSHLKRLVINWQNSQPDLRETFSDINPMQASVVESALRRAVENGDTRNNYVRRIVSEATKMWYECNLFRYSQYVHSLTAPAAQ